MKLIGEIIGEIDISSFKRCYVDAVLKIPCPHCGNEMKDDLKKEYIEYPGGREDKRYLTCHNCSTDETEVCFTLPLKFISAKIELEYDPSDLIPD